MQFGEVPLDEAEGAILAHAVTLAGARIPKGRTVDSALLAAARAEGLDRLWVARPDPGDIAEAEAAALLGAALAGEGVAAEPPVHGRVNLTATRDGLVLFDPARLREANQASEEIGIATLAPFAPVAAGELIATVKIIPYAIDRHMLSRVAERLPGIGVQGFRGGRRAILLRTLREGGATGNALDEAPDKAAAKAESVTRARLERLGMALELAPPVAHAIAPLAAALARARADLLLIAGATATADRRDVIPAAIEAAGGVVERVGMPVDPGNLLVLGWLGPTPVIGLPGCARSPKRNGLDLVLERLAAGLEVGSDLIAGMGAGGLLEESGRPVPWGWAG